MGAEIEVHCCSRGSPLKMEWTPEERASHIQDVELTDAGEELASNGEQEEVSFAWGGEKRGDCIEISEDGAGITRSSHYGWGSQVAATRFESGVYEVEVSCECVDDLGLFLGVVGAPYYDEDWDECVRDSTHFFGMNGNGKMFAGGKVKDLGFMRLNTGLFVSMRIDMDKRKLGFSLRGGSSSCELTGLPAAVSLCVSFGGKNQRVQVARVIKISDGL